MSSYRKQYFKIYFWQLISLLLNFAAMFIVTPLLTNMPTVYGVYSVCISLNVFLNYADLGFLLAGQKFASESFARNDTISEQKYLGTSVFIYLIMCVCLMVCIFVCYLNPGLVIKEIGESSELPIAKSLLLILTLSIPITVFQKFSQLIYNIRLEDFVVQRINIIGSFIRIISVPLLFFNNRYEIVGYYAFSQFTLLSTTILALILSKKKGYGLKKSISLIRFDKPSFNSMKGLATSGFLSSISWLICFEMDLVLVSSLLGAAMAAVYSIGRNLNNMFRSLFGIIYSPYSVRFNYFVGQGDDNGTKNFYFKLCRFFSYITVIPVIVFILYAEPFVIAWVGPEYMHSVTCVQILILCFLPNFLTAPASSVVIANNKFKSILIVSIVMPIIFYLGIFLTYAKFGVESFAFFKWLIGVYSGVYYMIIVYKMYNSNFVEFIRSTNIIKVSLPAIFAIVFSIICRQYLTDLSKSFMDLVLVSSHIIIISVFSIAVAVIVDRSYRKEIISIVKK